MTSKIKKPATGSGSRYLDLTDSQSNLNQSAVSPIFASIDNDPNNFKPRNSKADLGKFNKYRLSQLILDSDFKKEDGKIIPLATIQEGKIAINKSASLQFSKYSQNQISFVGNYGQQSAGKSFWYDKILNLSEFQGAYYSDAPKEPGLYFWSIPFSKKNLKIFLIDHVGFKSSEQLSEGDKKLLDFELLLCEKIVLISEPGDDLFGIAGSAYKQFGDSMSRLTVNDSKTKKSSEYWPNGLYALHRTTKSMSKEDEQLTNLFSDFNFSIVQDARNADVGTTHQNDKLVNESILKSKSSLLNESYVKRTSVIFQDIYEKMRGKRYEGVQYSGSSLAFLLNRASLNINKGDGSVDKIFADVRADIYQEKLQQSKKIYNHSIQTLETDPQPKSMDQLTHSFQVSSDSALQHFNKNNIHPQTHLEYQNKLENYTNSREQQILSENQAKTDKFWNEKLPSFDPTQRNPSQLQDYVADLKSSYNENMEEKHFDQNVSKPVANKLHGPINTANSLYLFGVSPELIKKQEGELEEEVGRKKKDLDYLKENRMSLVTAQYDTEKSKWAQKQVDMNNKQSKLQEEVNMRQRILHEDPQDAVLDMKQYLDKLQLIHSQNQQSIVKLQQQPTNQEVQRLQKAVEGEAGRVSVLESGVARYSQINSGKGQYRKIESQNIKKPTLK